MKILHVIEAFGGGALTSIQLCNLYADDHEVVLCCAPRQEAPTGWESLLSPKVRIVNLSGVMVRQISPVKDISALLKLVLLIRKERPDIVHSHSSKAGVLARFACLLTGTRSVYSPRGFAFLSKDFSPKKTKVYLALETITQKLCNHVSITAGCSNQEFHEANKLGHAVLLHNAIDVPLAQSLAKSGTARYTKTKPFLVATSGRISPQKQPWFFQQVVELTQAKCPDVEFLWVGGGDEDLAAKLTCPQTGWLNRADTLATVAVCDLYIQTSGMEGLPLSVLEAKALGKPVIATNIGGNEDTVTTASGFLCDTPEEFSDMILFAYRHKDIYDGLCEHSLKEMDYFNVTRMRQQYSELYDAMCVRKAEK